MNNYTTKEIEAIHKLYDLMKEYNVTFKDEYSYYSVFMSFNDSVREVCADNLECIKRVIDEASSDAAPIKEYKYWVDLEGGTCWGFIKTTELDSDKIKKLALEDASKTYDVSRAYVYKISLIEVD